jgi:hypothetical protein
MHDLDLPAVGQVDDERAKGLCFPDVLELLGVMPLSYHRVPVDAPDRGSDAERLAGSGKPPRSAEVLRGERQHLAES